MIVATQLIGCRNETHSSSPEAAQKELKSRGVEYNKDMFFKSVKAGDKDLINLFLDAGIDPKTTDENGYSALMLDASGKT
jgi:hypothetical protein